MPELCRFLGIVIRMYSREHNPPHFQAYYGEYEASFSIKPLEMIKGTLPPRVQGLVIEWAVMYVDDLQKIWEALQKGESKSIKKIKPLV
ncbi:MAG TPA: DUF4160 domain-containing protein [Waddliaceae bacterium]